MKIRVCVCLIIVVSLATFCPGFSDSVASERPNLEFENAEVNLENIRRTITYLEGLGNRTTWEKQWEAARWLAEEFRREGLETAIHEYDFRGQRWPNVIAEIPGKGANEELIILLAHLDSIAYDSPDLAPGADDNASGVAVLLEVARISKTLNLGKSVRFCIFSNEERGQAGSRAYVKSLEDKDRIKAVINLDVLGYSRPSFAFQLGPIWNIGTPWGKARAIYRMAINFYYGLSYPRKALMVAGRPANGALANLVASALEEGSNLTVRTLVGDDCG